MGPSPEQVAQAEAACEAISQASTPEVSRVSLKEKEKDVEGNLKDSDNVNSLEPPPDQGSSPTITNTSQSSPQHSQSSGIWIWITMNLKR